MWSVAASDPENEHLRVEGGGWMGTMSHCAGCRKGNSQEAAGHKGKNGAGG